MKSRVPDCISILSQSKLVMQNPSMQNTKLSINDSLRQSLHEKSILRSQRSLKRPETFHPIRDHSYLTITRQINSSANFGVDRKMTWDSLSTLKAADMREFVSADFDPERIIKEDESEDTIYLKSFGKLDQFDMSQKMGKRNQSKAVMQSYGS